MMLIVISNRPERVEDHRRLWGDHTVFTSPADTVREAHHDLAVHAVAEGWDQSVKVIQDDVRFDTPWPTHQDDVTSYHARVKTWHTCPRAFSATTAGWERLAQGWSRRGQTCELWRPDRWYDTAALITPEDLEAPRG